MPALMTHHLFGEESIERLPKGIIETDEDRAAFLLANQGPDPFFFRVRTPHVRECLKLAQVMHRSRLSAQFSAMREGVSRLQRHDASTGRAFALGMLSHYVLDRNAHPFVYAQQNGIIDTDPTLAGCGSEVHAVIEGDLDVLMLQLKRDGATVADYPPAGELMTNERIDKIAGALISHTAGTVYGLPVGASEYGGAVADMRLAYRLIEPYGSASSRVLSTLESAVRSKSILGALAHRVTLEPPRRTGNLDHLPWKNPFTQEVSRESFPELFDRALDDYAATAARFIAGVDMTEATGHVNYSGRPLGPDEEFDREE